MAQKVQVLLVDDIDQSEAHETLTFGLDGKTYEIDLNDTHAAELREVLAKFVKSGRRTGGRAAAGTRGRTAAKAAQGGPSTEEIRAWAKANGYDVKERGRVPQPVQEAYRAAHA